MMRKKLTWDDVRWDEEGNPGYNNKKAGGKIVGDDVRHHVPLKNLKVIIIMMIMTTKHF